MGNSDAVVTLAVPIPVHPHVCGELLADGIENIFLSGSSPRVWGTPVSGEAWGTVSRFIPTCVGNSYPIGLIFLSSKVHPHVCGELEPGVYNPSYGVGSSPRVWGTRRNFRSLHTEGRFIPTCVGNSMCAESQGLSVSVHPHVCGELLGRIRLARLRGGSSPRVWGTLSQNK